VAPRLANVIPGLFYNLLAGVDFTKVFPFVLMPQIPRIVPRPPLYFIEPIVGALWLAPFIPAALGVFFIKRLREAIWIVPVSALSVLFFLTLTGLSTQRYEVDFLPMPALAALAVIAELKNRALNIALLACVAFGTVVNAAMGITGPYDEITRNKPARYVAIARWFSPIPSLRPQLNPPFDVRFSSPVLKALDHEVKPLFHAGQRPYRYEVFIDHLDGKPVVVSLFGAERIIKEVSVSTAPVEFEVKYLPESGEAVVDVGGSELIRQKIGTLIAAPVEIAVVR
jgi:hypothetical protein